MASSTTSPPVHGPGPEIGHITQFSIVGLHSHKTITLELRDNRLVLVGENGSNKSTVLNALFYFMTRQWAKLAMLEMSAVELTIDTERLRITSEELRQTLPLRDLIQHRLAQKVGLGRIRSFMLEFDSGAMESATHEQIKRFGAIYGLPAGVVEEVLSVRRDYKRSSSASESLARATSVLSDRMRGQTLFLPTYRRIERDLQEIFKDLHVERETRRYHRRNTDSPGYVELVEFGMGDVESLFSETMRTLDRSFRAQLTKLTGNFLRFAIQSATAQDVGRDQVVAGRDEPLTDEEIRRLDELLKRASSILGEGEQRALIGHLSSSKAREARDAGADRIVSAFGRDLHRMLQEQVAREADVAMLVGICNAYLKPSGKGLEFDSSQFELNLRTDDGRLLQLRDLSSGEKQIVSLFTHILLSGPGAFFLIIDEPELSISVPWQQRFLLDVVASKKCGGIVAATHSPFLFDNEFRDYARGIGEFTTLLPRQEASS